MTTTNLAQRVMKFKKNTQGNKQTDSKTRRAR
jgi:hypothetical protein